ncbi:hypothetical protein TPAR_01814 [Tolypocladium paradoxum]|uniref:Uncharacterized protein n=1 Tax=Tolypocladium paradoxum TaxID=94208 RepID=A0A2S4L6A7_9HYPO|nr:hypothetical protein TPAR_01814 [Tolypocladium paradoxum]
MATPDGPTASGRLELLDSSAAQSFARHVSARAGPSPRHMPALCCPSQPRIANMGINGAAAVCNLFPPLQCVRPSTAPAPGAPRPPRPIRRPAAPPRNPKADKRRKGDPRPERTPAHRSADSRARACTVDDVFTCMHARFECDKNSTRNTRIGASKPQPASLVGLVSPGLCHRPVVLAGPQAQTAPPALVRGPLMHRDIAGPPRTPPPRPPPKEIKSFPASRVQLFAGPGKGLRGANAFQQRCLFNVESLSSCTSTSTCYTGNWGRCALISTRHVVSSSPTPVPPLPAPSARVNEPSLHVPKL